MPIYEYGCRQCSKKWNKLWSITPTVADEEALRCRTCGGRLERRFSPFATPRSEEKRLSSLAEGALNGEGVDESDPRSLARLMRRLSEETGEALEGEEQEMLERLEAGEMPEDFEEGGSGEGGGSGGEDFLCPGGRWRALQLTDLERLEGRLRPPLNRWREDELSVTILEKRT